MLTKEQKNEIREIVAKTWELFPASYSESVGAAVAAGIQVYDEMKDVEDVKAAANKKKQEQLSKELDLDNSPLTEALKELLKAAANFNEVTASECCIEWTRLYFASLRESKAVAVFRPHRGGLDDAMKEVRVFETKEQMLNKLKEEYGEKVAIDDDEIEDDRIGWLHSQYVTQELKLRFGGTEKVVIGICDCKTFKRG